MIIFVKQKYRHGCREQTYGNQGGGGGGMNWETDIYTLLILHRKWITMRTYCIKNKNKRIAKKINT